MSYLFFSADKNRKFDTLDGQGTLGEHLEYLDNFGGTPDFWDSTDTASLSKAKTQAAESGMHLYIVNESMYRVVGEVNKPEQST